MGVASEGEAWIDMPLGEILLVLLAQEVLGALRVVTLIDCFLVCPKSTVGMLHISKWMYAIIHR